MADRSIAGASLVLGAMLLFACSDRSSFQRNGVGGHTSEAGGAAGATAAVDGSGSAGGAGGSLDGGLGTGRVASPDPGTLDGGAPMDSHATSTCAVWSAPLPSPGVAVDAICTSTDSTVSSPEFCYPLANSLDNSNTLFSVGLYCGRGRWQLAGAQTVKVVSGSATVSGVVAMANSWPAAAGFTLSLASPPQDGDGVTLEIESSIQCADGPRTVVSTMILAYCGGEHAWVGGSSAESRTCNECPIRGSLPV